MEIALIGIIVFLFVLAVFDLSAGVSNDAANFLNSAIGSKAASFRTVILIAAAGILIGALTSSGMIEVVRGGIFRPEFFSFYDVICIFMAVMVTDVIMLDIFNSLGMPTSTTVSLVFELLGAAFAVSIIKIAGSDSYTLGQLLNTEKAMEVILAIFLSVAIAFVFGTVVQYLARLWFTFDYRRGLKWKAGVFGGVCATGIVYFLLIKGAPDMSFMTQESREWISANTPAIVGVCLVSSVVIMQLLHMIGVNVLKVVVLLGTFALAMAFAGNDLVNFIGVPVTGFASFQDYMLSGAGDMRSLSMGSLNGHATIPTVFLIVSASIMIAALFLSKKARKVVDTSVNLARQDSGDELFGSSKLARACVRKSINLSRWIVAHTPAAVKDWTARRLDVNEAVIQQGAAFDLVRGSINLVLAGMLIALGTSMKLPLSTTYVTFMVAMGTSLADKAWGRESAVFRITGVISVIGGWFITAGAAFVGTAIIVTVMHLGGMAAICITACIAIFIIVRNNLKKDRGEDHSDELLYSRIMSCTDRRECWSMLKEYMVGTQTRFLEYSAGVYRATVEGFTSDDPKVLAATLNSLKEKHRMMKVNRSRLTMAFKRIDAGAAIELSAWFHISVNSLMEMIHNLQRIAETCHEHIDNNFPTLPDDCSREALDLCGEVSALMDEACVVILSPTRDTVISLRQRCSEVKTSLSNATQSALRRIRKSPDKDMAVLYIYVNLLQESQEITSHLRKFLRSDAKLLLSPDIRIRQ